MQESTSRRRFLGHFGAAAMAAMAAGTPWAGATPAARPNIMFVLIDDLRWDAFGYMDHPFVKTPNIDRIRREGVLFENAFVTTSLCSPARASFLTGSYAHTHRSTSIGSLTVTTSWRCPGPPMTTGSGAPTTITTPTS